MRSALRNWGVIALISLIAFSWQDTLAQVPGSPQIPQDSMVWVPRWRARMIAQTEVRFDSVVQENNRLMKDYEDQKKISALRLKTITFQGEQISECHQQVALLSESNQELRKMAPIIKTLERQKKGYKIGFFGALGVAAAAVVKLAISH